jgi:hypothetical protein
MERIIDRKKKKLTDIGLGFSFGYGLKKLTGRFTAD